MPSHVYHEPIETHGLADDCERCDEIAAHPIEYLDEQNFRAVWAQMLAVEFGDSSYRSANERAAGKILYSTALFVERHLGMNPRTVLA